MTLTLTGTDLFIYNLGKMRKTYVVEIFCEVNLDEYDKAIGESFTKLAFEAVEKIINVSLILPLVYLSKLIEMVT